MTTLGSFRRTISVSPKVRSSRKEERERKRYFCAGEIKIVKQFNFKPDGLPEHLIVADCDYLQLCDPDRFKKTVFSFAGGGMHYLKRRIDNVPPNLVIDFLKILLSADESIPWDGFKVYYEDNEYKCLRKYVFALSCSGTPKRKARKRPKNS